MTFSFGICASENNIKYHQTIIDSIKNLNIPTENYEIILIGDSKCNPQLNDIRFIEFDETIRNGWITKKKNILAQESKFENLVIVHDYITFEKDWYDGYLKFGNNFIVSMNKIVDPNNERFVDWLVLHEEIKVPNSELLLPYDWLHCSKCMYIPGNYFVVKKQFLLNNPLNENLIWGQAEDVEWSRRIRNYINFAINPNSSVKLLKFKEYKFNEMSEQSKEIMRQYGF